MKKVVAKVLKRKSWEEDRKMSSSRHPKDLMIAFNYSFGCIETGDIEVSVIVASPGTAEDMRKDFGNKVMGATIVPCEDCPEDVVVPAGSRKGLFKSAVVKLVSGKRIHFSLADEEEYRVTKKKHSKEYRNMKRRHAREMKKFMSEFDSKVVESL